MNVAGVGKNIAHKGSFPKSNSIGFNTSTRHYTRGSSLWYMQTRKRIKGKKTRKEEVVFSHR